MKALVLRHHGDLDSVAYEEVARPEIGPDDVLVEILAAALNHLDLWVTKGWPSLTLDFPHVLGADGAGVVAVVGSNVADVVPGERVAIDPTIGCGRCLYCRKGQFQMCDRFALLGEHVPGVFATYAAVPARNVIRLPDDVPFSVAAAASLTFVTAWHSLITAGRFRAGEELLVVGAGGGVNTAAIQIARLAGARRIYVVGSNDEKLALAETLGADVLVNRKREEWGSAIYRKSGRRGVDVVVDNVGAATFHKSLRSLKKGGRLLTVGNTSGARFELDNRLIFGKHLQIIGTTMGPHDDYVTAMEMVFSGQLRPIIDSVYPLEDGVQALRRLQSGDVAGKLVLERNLS